MAGDGRRDGIDPFEVAARRDDVEDPSVIGFHLPTEVALPKQRRWPQALRRYAALTIAVVLAVASAFVLGRSLRPDGEIARAQQLVGKAPTKNSIAHVDLSPDWTHTRGLDGRRRTDRRAHGNKHRRTPRRSTVRLNGGHTRPARPSAATTVAAVSSAGNASQHGHRSHKGSGKDKDNQQHAAPEEPQLPEPAVPLYHLYRTFKKKKPNHFFTGDAAAKDEKIESGWQFLATEGFMFDREYEGTVAVPVDNGTPGYIYAEKEPGSLPLYMLRGYNGFGDIFTSDAAYRDNMIEEGWNDFGTVGYIAQT